MAVCNSLYNRIQFRGRKIILIFKVHPTPKKEIVIAFT
jgi:hypothetical protein